MSSEVLVVGGAGYIGSQMVKLLLDTGEDVAILDNFSTGHREAVLGGQLIEGDLGDVMLLDRLLGTARFDAVMHFAAFSQVGESVRRPDAYFVNNTAKTAVLLEAMARHGVQYFIFSSTAAVFGEPRYTPIDEAHPRAPINPYGRSKMMVEDMLADFEAAFGMRSAVLRYFNAAGADPEGLLGERHEPESHLIPLALQAVSGRGKPLVVFGDDYDTPDGTCVRDYVHIVDLAQAHLRALTKLRGGAASMQINLGNGAGYSVRQVLDAVARISGQSVPHSVGARRTGDPARLVASSEKARALLDWQARFPELDTIVEHAWRWEQKQAAR